MRKFTEMKNILVALLLVSNAMIAKVTEKEIIAEVVFENLTGTQLSAGEFFVLKTNERIKISDTKSFTITLPSKGKYVFAFSTEEFTGLQLLSRSNHRKEEYNNY